MYVFVAKKFVYKMSKPCSQQGVVLYRDHSDGACVAVLLLRSGNFYVKNNFRRRCQIFMVCSIHEILTVDGYSMDECLERS